MLNESLKNILAKDVTEQIRAAEAGGRKAGEQRKAAGFADEVKRIIRAEERRAAETERPDALQKPKAAAKKASGAESRAATDRNQGINNNIETRKHVTVSETAVNSKSAVKEYAAGKPAVSETYAKEFNAAQHIPASEEFSAIPVIEGAALEVRNNQASGLISAALAKISSMLNLPSSVSFDEQSLIRFDQESLEQFAEILHALESIGNLLEMVAAGGENLDAGGVDISADEAAMLSADLRVEKFHIQMGLSMIGAREIVSGIMAEKYDAPLAASGISQAADPASLGMSATDTARAFGSLTVEDLTAAIERIKLAKSGQTENVTAQNTETELTAAGSQEMRAMFKIEDIGVKINNIDVKVNVKNEDIGVKIDTVSVNKSFVDIPQSKADVPQSFADIPQSLADVQKSLADIPQSFADIPQSLADIPQSFADVPRSLADIPQSLADIPQSFADIPQGLADIPQGLADIPQGFSDIPQGFSDIPQGLAGIPQDKADIAKNVDMDNDTPEKPEQAKVENIKVENVKAEDVKVEQVKVENIKVEDVKAEDVKVEQAKVENVKLEQVKVENVKAEDVKLEQVKAENIKAQDVDGVKPENVKAKANNTDSEHVETNVAKSEYAAVENAEAEQAKPKSGKDVKSENVKAKDVKSENVKFENVKSEKVFNSINIPLSVSELANAKTRETKTESSDAKYAAGFAGVSIANEEAAESAKSDKGAFALNAASQQNVITASEADGAEPQADIVQADIAQAKAQAAVEHVQKATNAFSRVDNEEIIRQITEKMHHAIRNGVQEVRMVLRPEALGEVRMSLRVEGDVVFARIQVENSQVKAIVESQLQNLKDSLEQQNLHAGAFSVDVGADSDRSPREAWQELAEAARRSKFREGGVERMGETDADAVGSAAGTDTGRRFGNNSFELFI